jgi:hypothetical protein
MLFVASMQLRGGGIASRGRSRSFAVLDGAQHGCNDADNDEASGGFASDKEATVRERKYDGTGEAAGPRL